MQVLPPQVVNYFHFNPSKDADPITTISESSLTRFQEYLVETCKHPDRQYIKSIHMVPISKKKRTCFTIMMKLDFLLTDMEVIFVLKYNSEHSVLRSDTFYAYPFTGIILKCENQQQRELMTKYALKMNNKMIYGSHHVNVQGAFVFKLIHRIEPYLNIIIKNAKSIEDFNQLQFGKQIDCMLDTQKQIVQFQLRKTLYCLGKTSIKIFIDQKFLASKLAQRNIAKETFAEIQRIKEIIKYKNFTLKGDESQWSSPQYATQKKQIQEITISQEMKSYIEGQVQQEESEMFRGGFGRIHVVKMEYTMLNEIIKRELVVKSNIYEQQKIDNEIKTLISYNNSGQKASAFIAQYYYSPQTPNMIYLEQYNYQSLLSMAGAKRITLFSRFQIMLHIAYGVKALHQANITHNDLKPQNIVVNQSLVPKIIDFGEASYENKESSDEGISLPYGAPERVNESKFKKQELSSDIFSIGMILYELMFGCLPFDYHNAQNKQEIESQYRSAKYVVRKPYFTGEKTIMKRVYELCCLCMQPDPTKRPDIQVIVVVLRRLMFLQDRLF